MKQILLLPFILFFSVAKAQCFRNKDGSVECAFGFLGLKSREQTASYVDLKTAKQDPIYIVDGTITNLAAVKKINPEDIEDISIPRKEGQRKNYFSCRPLNDVIIITTKKTDQRTIQVKDIISNEPLPAASVELIYGRHKKDTMRFVADLRGFVETNKIVSGEEYELRVSSVGYKTYSSSIRVAISDNNYSVALERNYLQASEVIVVSGTVCRCRCFRPSCTVVRKDSVMKLQSKAVPSGTPQMDIKIYPNPVGRSQNINIEFENKSDSKVTIRVFSLDNKRIDTREYHAMEGMNRINYLIDARLPSGVYIIQLVDGNDQLVKSEKIIVR